MYTAQGKINHDALLEEHLPAVRRQALALQVKLPSGIDLDDLIQAGTVGLLDALQRFDANAGASFSTFASQRIRGAMIDELRTRDWLPRSVRRNARAVDQCVHRLEQKLGRPAEQREQLTAAIETLPEREKLLLALYYQEELNLKEIGAVLGVTESRVCQLHSQAVSRLRAKLVAQDA